MFGVGHFTERRMQTKRTSTFPSRSVSAALALACTLILTAATHAEVRLPHILGDHMVLQKDKPITLWGWASPGEAVSVQIGGPSSTPTSETAHTTANAKGEWRLTLPARSQPGPVSLEVDGTNKITINDAVVGEVWLCSGQSNMEMGVGVAAHGKEEIAAADHPEIRLFLVPKKISATPLPDFDSGEWRVCSPQTLGEGGWSGFSAAAYYFGRELNRELKLPVGLIDSSWGGTRIEPWMPPEAFASSPRLSDLNDRQKLANPAAPEHAARLDKFLAELATWETSARSAAADHKPVPTMPAFPAELNFKDDPQTPTALFNGMLNPIVPFAIRGAIWYQGESNHAEPKIYLELTRAKLAAWRKIWGEDLAYYFVQIAPFQYGDDQPTVLPEFWETQDAIQSIPGTGMVVTNDIGEANDIHPKNKQEVGRRLALWALAKTYGKTDVAYRGPVFRSMRAEGPNLRVTFDSADGLKTRDGKPPTHFEIIDAEDGGFVPATAKIDGNAVVLSAQDVRNPVAVRFAWDKLAQPNLTNAAGLPATAFRAGATIARDLLRLHVPEAKDYKLAYDLDLAKLSPLTYAVDDHAKLNGPISRIGYFVELSAPEGSTKYVWVSMKAFTQELSKIAIPTYESGASFQQNVEDLTVISNIKGIVNGKGLTGGNIEFWPNNYAPANAAHVANASDTTFDFGDEKTDPVLGYGSMQVHNHDAKQTLFAINHWLVGPQADLGIGNAPKDNPDWTFAANASSYPAKRLRVFVKLGT
jgi:sialate O-acetylesterase